MSRSLLLCCVAAANLAPLVSSGRLAEMAVPPSNPQLFNVDASSDAFNRTFWRAEELKNFRKKAKAERKQRFLNRKKAKSVLDRFPKAPAGNVELVSEAEWKEIQQKQANRGLSWFGGSSGGAYNNAGLADPSEYYDKWAQAYRMLGGFIDCDHDKSDDSHDSGDEDNNNNNNNNQGDDDSSCSRWMMWASYVNPNYQGNEYYEYYGDNPVSVLDCHSPDTEWKLLGVYRQEFYQFIEQISKHLWAVDDQEYVIALAGLAYMTDYDCFAVGNDNDGNVIYAGVAPQPYAKFQMALYTDMYCLTPNENLGMTFDDFGLTSGVNLGSKDDTDDYSSVEELWYETQEYTLANLNDVYEEFKYCTSCVDYPTYQDGYFIGDYGTDDDDLINQCWKFYSHDSYTCEADCITMAHAQGTILSFKYGDTTFGNSEKGFYQHSNSVGEGSTGVVESRITRWAANAFLTVSVLLFLTNFLAFAVARRSRYRDRSSRSKRLLQKDRRRSKSRSRRSEEVPEDDGLFRSSTRSKSSRSKSRSKRSGSSRKYEAPTSSRSKSRDDQKNTF